MLTQSPLRRDYWTPYFYCCFLMVVSQIAAAQKIDIDRAHAITSWIHLPNSKVDSSFHTYSCTVEDAYNLGSYGLIESEMKKNYCTINGYAPLEFNGDLRVNVTILPFKILDATVVSRVEKTKDKSGRELSQTYYKYQVSYQGGLTWILMDKNDNKLLVKSLSMFVSIEKSFGNEYGTYKEASDSYNNNRASIHREIASSLITPQLSEMNSKINNEFGYYPVKERFVLWTLDTKKHPENEIFRKNIDAAKAAFNAISANGLTAKDSAAIKPIEDYFSEIPKKYTGTEKNDLKLRYVAYYNLAQMAYYMDDFDKASEYANLLIQNEYDEKDGKNILKDVKNTQSFLANRYKSSRRFTR